MDEILQKLLEADVLSESTKKELDKAFKTKLQEAIDETKKLTAAEVKADLAEQWISERDALIEAIDSKVTEFLNEEMAELREDINRFRDLEVEYAEKLTEAKSQMSKELQSDLGQLVEKLDSFLEIRLNSEIEELREDIQIQKQNNFGRIIFEAVAKEFQNNYVDENQISENLRESKLRLKDTAKALKLAESKLSKIEREQKMASVLAPLSGRSREVMEAILKNVSTNQLEEGYKTFIGRVLKESDESENITPRKKIIKESFKKSSEISLDDLILTEGNTRSEKIDEYKQQQLSEEAKIKLKKLAGL